MEEDRRQTDLGTAADIEEAQLAQASPSPAIENETEVTPLKQPKKRFVGRRAATEVAAKNGSSGAAGESGAVAST
jgi:2-(3-amino-3-carboxypropyl)histidine synthase